MQCAGSRVKDRVLGCMYVQGAEGKRVQQKKAHREASGVDGGPAEQLSQEPHDGLWSGMSDAAGTSSEKDI